MDRQQWRLHGKLIDMVEEFWKAVVLDAFEFHSIGQGREVELSYVSRNVESRHCE
jgi:hypothetical protein